jgi:hypothetical protein
MAGWDQSADPGVMKPAAKQHARYIILRAAYTLARQHFLYFFPLPQVHSSFLPGGFCPGAGIIGGSSSNISSSSFLASRDIRSRLHNRKVCFDREP